MSTEAQLFKGALKPTLVAGVFSLIASTLYKGLAGFVGALLAQCIVLIFFAVHLIISKYTRDADPMATMALVMISYFIKIFLFGAFLLAVTHLLPEDKCNRIAFGVSAIVATLVWLVAEIVAYMKLKTHLQLPPQK
jgi:hypothetical protein